MHLTIQENNFKDIYVQLLDHLLNNADYISRPRGLTITEILDVSFVLTNPLCNLYSNPVRSPDLKYLAGELFWYFSGSNKLADISPYSKFWNKIANEDKTLNSAYGHNIFCQYNEHLMSEWQWAIHCLIQDPDTRQAIIRINKPMHSFIGNKDFPCTMFGQFFIREGKLIFSVTMRSQDINKGLNYDLPFFTILQQQMLHTLQKTYPDLELGRYIHHANSFHLYYTDIDLIKASMKEAFTIEFLPALTTALDLKTFYDGKTNLNNKLYQWIMDNK